MPLVGIVIGSKSDQDIADETAKVLDSLGISYESSVISAHRKPEETRNYGKNAAGRGIEVIIAGAGGSAALPGALASWTTLPIIGVPIASSDMNGVDSLYTIAQMPPGIPVACMAIGLWGARNAAYMAAAILSLKHEDVKKSYEGYRQDLSAS
ncbi:MAG: 5-(carboxyamino)imidazole ribonucleotide mutase [SAR202 cluster bacterium]|nr:5-(carboxyamino)imidazole ribonucleotide mutase [SAR202 cluster bacterium]|tara:strand:- start:47408 stop:47866 length:459 start_codon:yes stop_codon:yes gene_type:complete